MRRPTLLTLSLVAAASLLLSACGGGSVEGPPTAQALQSMQELASYCNLDVPADDGTATLHQAWGQVVIDHVQYDTAGEMAVRGFNLPDFQTDMTHVPLSDRRGVQTANAMAGVAFPDRMMGIWIPPSFQAGSAMCVKGLTGWFAQSQGDYVLRWGAQQDPAVDTSTLPFPAIDGFEWVTNFQPQGGMAVFVVPKELVSPAGSVICRRDPAAGAPWLCMPAKASDGGAHWTLSAPAAAPGLYVLAAPRPV